MKRILLFLVVVCACLMPYGANHAEAKDVSSDSAAIEARGQVHDYYFYVISEEDRQPVIGASIVVKGTNIGTTTDITGRATLRAPKGKKVVISYIGMQAVEYLLSSQTEIYIVMKSDAQSLN